MILIMIILQYNVQFSVAVVASRGGDASLTINNDLMNDDEQ